jgi:single-stranded DNA-binding protein
VKGTQCALQGRLGADLELRRSESGKDWCRLSVGVESSRNAYKGGTRAILRELAPLLREQGEALKRIG